MKKVLFCVLFLSALYNNCHGVSTLSQPVSAVVQPGDYNEFDSCMDEMINQGMVTENIEIKEPSTFQMFLRRVGGPIVMVYIRMREKMNVLWAWLTLKNRKKNNPQV